jgi:hypothetical protein
MIKQLEVEIAESSWRAQPEAMRHEIPPEFSTSSQSNTINFLRAMLLLGTVTVPAGIPRWGMSTNWAMVRYLTMLDESSPSLRLHPAISDLDPHLKTVLSDDWGVALSLQWLDSQFRYLQKENGLSLLKRLQRDGLATYNGPSKRRGPSKCPDFICTDKQGKLHIIECKGTQESKTKLARQLQDGRSQKRNVIFMDESQFVSQRLVVGVAIARSDDKWDSVLRIEDPTPNREKPHFFVKLSNLNDLLIELKIGTLARTLRLSGETQLLRKILRKEYEEYDFGLLSTRSTERFVNFAGEWQGSVERTRMPIGLLLNNRPIRWVTVRHGIRPEVLESLNGLKAIEKRAVAELSGRRHDVSEAGSLQQVEHARSGELYAAVHWGEAQMSDIELD